MLRLILLVVLSLLVSGCYVQGKATSWDGDVDAETFLFMDGCQAAATTSLVEYLGPNYHWRYECSHKLLGLTLSKRYFSQGAELEAEGTPAVLAGVDARRESPGIEWEAAARLLAWPLIIIVLAIYGRWLARARAEGRAKGFAHKDLSTIGPKLSAWWIVGAVVAVGLVLMVLPLL